MKFENNDIQYLLYKLIDEPKAKEEKDYNKYNSHPDDYLGKNKTQTETELVLQLKQTLDKLCVIIPILESVDDGRLIVLDESQVYLQKQGTKQAEPASHKLRGMVKASVPSRKLHSLIKDNTSTAGIVDTKRGSIFYVSVPYNDFISVLKQGRGT